MVSLARLCGIFPRFPKKQALRLRNGETTNTVARCEISVSRRVGNCEIEPQVAAFLQGFRGRNESQAGERETFDFGTRGTSLPKKKSAIYPWVVACGYLGTCKHPLCFVHCTKSNAP